MSLFLGVPVHLAYHLYRAEGTSMFAGCLPLLIQIPAFSLMYRLFLDHSVAGTPNTLLTHSLLAAPLGSHWLAGAGPLSAHGAVFAGCSRCWRGSRCWASGPPAGRRRDARRPREGISGDPRRGPRRRAAHLDHAVRVPGDGRDRAAGRRAVLLTTTAWTLAERTVLRRRFDRSPRRHGPAAALPPPAQPRPIPLPAGR